MIDITNKEVRTELINRYLEAETSPDEERALIDYYIKHDKADDDELAFARMIMMANRPSLLLSDEGVQEYDRIVSAINSSSHKRISYKWVTWLGGVAASIALIFLFIPASPPPSSATEEIAQSIQQLMLLGSEDIESVAATPIDNRIWVQTQLKDGSTQIFIMSKNDDTETTTLLTI